LKKVGHVPEWLTKMKCLILNVKAMCVDCLIGWQDNNVDHDVF